MSTTEAINSHDEDRQRILDMIRIRAETLGDDAPTDLVEAQYDAASMVLLSHATALARQFKNPCQTLAVLVALLPAYARAIFADPDAVDSFDRVLRGYLEAKLPHIIDGDMRAPPPFS